MTTTQQPAGKPCIIAIDGPSGVGKGTVARIVASHLGYRHIDSGAMYRAVAWKVLRHETALDDEPAVTALARGSRVETEAGTVKIDGEDITRAIRTPDIDRAATAVARFPGVRVALIGALRLLAVGSGLVVEGRDIGTVVFPGAALKIYLDASAEERARRRVSRTPSSSSSTSSALGGRGPGQSTAIHVAADAVFIDTTRRSIDEVVSQVIRLTADGRPERDTNATQDTRYLAIGLIDGRLRTVSLGLDGSYEFIDPHQQPHNILYHVSSETLTLQEAVDELEALLNDRSASEHAFQQFFERYPDFILTDEHARAKPHIVLQRDQDGDGPLIPDFVLEPIEQSGLVDLLEIKLPSAPLFVRRKSRMRHSAAVMEACAQLREYSAFFDDARNRRLVHARYGLTAYRPKLFVVIGRRPSVDTFEARRIADDLPARIRLRTYDDILERMLRRLARAKGEVV